MHACRQRRRAAASVGERVQLPHQRAQQRQRLSCHPHHRPEGGNREGHCQNQGHCWEGGKPPVPSVLVEWMSERTNLVETGHRVHSLPPTVLPLGARSVQWECRQTHQGIRHQDQHPAQFCSEWGTFMILIEFGRGKGFGEFDLAISL